MPIHHWREKPIRPALNRAHGLFSGLVFASCPGWTNGRGQGATPIGEVEDLRNQRGVWNAAVNNHSPWEGGLGWGGLALDNGDGSFTSAPEFLLPAGDTRWDISYGFTAAVLVRPDVLSTDATIPIFKRRNQPYGATDTGWHFSAAAGNTWRFAYSDGAGERQCTGTTTQNLFRADLLLAIVLPTTSTLYVNGKSEATTSGAARNMGNPSGTPIKFLGLGTAGAGQPNYAGLVSVGYVWDRVLSQAEINLLASDAFAPYRQTSFDEELAFLEDAPMGFEHNALPPEAAPDVGDEEDVFLQSYLLSF